MYAKKRYRPRHMTQFNGRLYTPKHTSINLGNKVPVLFGNNITYKNVLRSVLTPALVINVTFNTIIQNTITISLHLKIRGLSGKYPNILDISRTGSVALL